MSRSVAPSASLRDSRQQAGNLVCIVANEYSDRALLSSLCDLIGHPASEVFGSAVELCAAYASGNRPAPAVVILDEPYSSPSSSVVEIRRITSLVDTLILVADGSSDYRRIDECLQVGALDHLSKPILMAEFGLRVRGALRLAEEIARRKQRELELDQSLRRIDKDLAAAARLQRNLLPDPGDKGHLRVVWGFRPCDSLGGDLLNVIAMEDCTYWYLFDVAGHGIPAALFAVGLHRLLSDGPGSLLRDGNGQPRDPAEILNDLNQRFPLDPETLIYFTIALACHHRSTGVMQYAQAGHPPMLASTIGQGPIELDLSGPPIGMLDGRPFRSASIPLSGGARVLVYSDGISETLQPQSGEAYGSARLARWLADTQHSSNELVTAIFDDLAAWRSSEPITDDLSLMIIEVA